MTQHGEEELPVLNSALLNSNELLSLFRDYRACTSIDEIRTKPDRGQAPLASHVDLDQALELLQTGSVRGVQVRYQFEGGAWCDTLLRVEGGVRIVRVRNSS